MNFCLYIWEEKLVLLQKCWVNSVYGSKPVPSLTLGYVASFEAVDIFHKVAVKLGEVIEIDKPLTICLPGAN
jgi:hypothetical protein